MHKLAWSGIWHAVWCAEALSPVEGACRSRTTHGRRGGAGSQWCQSAACGQGSTHLCASTAARGLKHTPGCTTAYAAAHALPSASKAHMPPPPSPVGVVDVLVALQQVVVVHMVVLSHLQGPARAAGKPAGRSSQAATRVRSNAAAADGGGGPSRRRHTNAAAPRCCRWRVPQYAENSRRAGSRPSPPCAGSSGGGLRRGHGAGGGRQVSQGATAGAGHRASRSRFHVRSSNLERRTGAGLRRQRRSRAPRLLVAPVAREPPRRPLICALNRGQNEVSPCTAGAKHTRRPSSARPLTERSDGAIALAQAVCTTGLLPFTANSNVVSGRETMVWNVGAWASYAQHSNHPGSGASGPQRLPCRTEPYQSCAPRQNLLSGARV